MRHSVLLVASLAAYMSLPAPGWAQPSGSPPANSDFSASTWSRGFKSASTLERYHRLLCRWLQSVKFAA